MTIDEIITAERDNAEFSKENNYDKSADYHNQIAELLEELKAYRENSNGYNKEDIELNRNAMYNKAIDDFIRKCEMESRVILDEIIHLSYYGLSMRELQRIAEQLKAGGENVQKK